MGILIIDSETTKALTELKEHAEANPFSMDMLREIKAGTRTIPGDTKEFSRYLTFGYKVVFTTENQDAGHIRHLSVSSKEKESVPPVYFVREIMKILGFENKLEDCKISMEKIGDYHHAVNIHEIAELKT